MHRRRTGGFTCIELGAVVALVGVLVAMQLAMAGHQRAQSSARSDLAKFRLIGQASAMYAESNTDRLFTFSWRPGELPVTPNTELALANADLVPGTADADLQAAKLQELDLVTRGIKGGLLEPTPDLVPEYHIPHVTFSHLVLAHFMGESQPSDVFISSADAARNYWAAHLGKYLDDPRGGPFLPPTQTTDYRHLWRWPFSSSFMVGPSHYSPDQGPPRTVERGSNQRTWRVPNMPGLLGRRSMVEVAHPSAKVMMFDEFDRYSGPFGRYMGLSNAHSIMNFYDGHAQRLATARSNFGFAPNNPDYGADQPDQPSRTYFYSPLLGWDPPDAVRRIVPVYYDQTRGGLQGVDFPGQSTRRPVPAQRK